MTGTRRLSRELALQVLFQQEFSPQQTVHAGLENFRRSFEASPEVWSYALEMLEGVEKSAKDIDALISKSSAHWTLKRMALVDLNIMRLAVYEMKFAPTENTTPPAVAINEAVEISKKFGTVDSAAFVNGILDQIVKQ
ncbi:MAG: transcription antitermination factor NusB [Bdellovibrionales bacterium]|nr:transcription antitermination factor NusB [Bdellovibrionales bacterium]